MPDLRSPGTGCAWPLVTGDDRRRDRMTDDWSQMKDPNESTLHKMQHCRILACKSFQNKYITALMLQQWNESQNPSPTPIHDESWRWCSESCHWKSPRETAHSWQVAVNDDEVNCIACLWKSLSAPILATSWLETLPQTPSDKSKGHEKRLHWDKHSSGSPARKNDQTWKLKSAAKTLW